MPTVKEIFYTIQGEGFHAGTPALFVRFTGCNLWSGVERNRVRDANRTASKCPLFCDTDFVGGQSLTPVELAAKAAEVAPNDVPLIVLTGGEPFLQITPDIIKCLRNVFRSATIAVETNGTVQPKVSVGTVSGVDWVCVSPKTAVSSIVIRNGSELKVVVPSYNPLEYISILDGFQHLFVSPEATPLVERTSLLIQKNIQSAVSWVMDNPRWKLSLQTHKVTGVP